MTSRREWDVIATWPDGSQHRVPYDTAEGAYRFAALVRRDWPGAGVELEEREIITRVVERRVVPRTEEATR